MTRLHLKWGASTNVCKQARRGPEPEAGSAGTGRNPIEYRYTLGDSLCSL